MLLLVCAGRRAAEAVLPGARVLAWDAEAAEALESASIPCDNAESLLGAAGREATEDAAIAWTKDFGRRPLQDGRSLREILDWRGLPLFYFAELYLFHSTRAPGYVRTIEILHRVLQSLRPTEVEAAFLPPAEARLLQRTCTALGVLFHGDLGRRGGAGALRVSWESRWNNLKTALSALKAALARRPAPPPREGRRVLFLSHAAFWKLRRDPETGAAREFEHYFDALLPGVASDPALQPYVLGVGPRAAFRRRGRRARLAEWLRLRPEAGPYVHVNRFTSPRVAAEVRRATRRIRTLWRSLRNSPAAHEAFSHRGVPFLDLAGSDLAGTLLLQLPWAVRCCEEMSEVLARVEPALVVLYAESSGWGRAALGACRARGVPSLAIQHGILYPRYYSYLHAADEADCPRPDRSAVFGEAARRFLVAQGHYAPEALVVTGSPKFDELQELARRLDRAALRRGLGVGPEQQLLVVASRYRGIRHTHPAIGSAFAGLLQAVKEMPSVRLVVKPHPAESAEPYARAVRDAAVAAKVTPPRSELLELLVACDALVTVESLSAVEALVLGRPVLVLNMPTNLAEIVEQGMALGVAAGQDAGPALRRLLFDADTRVALERARARHLQDVAHGLDGRATERILALIRGLAGLAC
jgi:hypothetical protein